MRGLDRTAPNIYCDEVFSLLRLLTALRQEVNERVQRRRCRVAQKTEKMLDAAEVGDAGRGSSLAERGPFIYTYPLLNRHFLKQEQSVKCLSAHFNQTVGTVPKFTDSGNA
jgi:hypothetical protein